ncbi:MAG: D-alanine--D-alanine ligase [Deltaproteobacteria bacterium]|nr:D-alanine--D-alanine ligase [Deltaproteobacteria bacterium]
MNKRIGVLFGGLSSERDLSLRTGEAVSAVLEERGYMVQRIFVDRDIDLLLRQARIDVAFVALHGRFGEDGCVQGLLELLGIPYTGSDVLASALAMNKARAKEVFRLHNLPTPACYVVQRQSSDTAIADHTLGFPAVIKPCHQGSSVGVSIAHNRDELELAFEEAFRFDDEILVERLACGKEVSVAILNDRALGAIEILPSQGFYDFSAKHVAGASEHVMPARLSPERYRGVLTQALLAHRALGCSGATRVDMIVSDRQNESILEVNTIPSMTPGGLFAQIALHSGLEFGDLVEEILVSARLATLGRWQNERRMARKPFPGPERRTTGTAEPH